MPCIRVCNTTQYDEKSPFISLRKEWEKWDLRILCLFILLAQLYFLLFGRRRRKSRTVLMNIVNIWLLYLFSELLATIALGKLSKLRVSDDPKLPNNGTGSSNVNHTMPMADEKRLRVMWGPLLLFYLGGPDTITVLRAEENQLWIRHLVGFFTLSTRAAYALIVTWDRLSLVAALIFVPAIIKYGERVWVIKSRSKDDYEGFVQLDLRRVDKISPSQPNAKIVLLAYFWFQTLMPHNLGYKCIGDRVNNLIKDFHQKVRAGTVDQLDPFKLIEIEMGLMYDVLFSKVGTIFTMLGSILRVLSFSLIVSVLVIYSKCDKPPRLLKHVCNKPSELLKGDHEITIILVAGAIVLEIGGIVVQLASDWALVWACKYRNQGTSLVRSLHEILFSKRQRWSGLVGQFSLRDFCTNYKDKPNVWNKMWIQFEPEKVFKRFSSQKSVAQHFKDIIIGHLREKSVKVADIDTAQTSAKKFAAVDTSQTSTDQKDVDNSEISTDKIGGSDNVAAQTSPEEVANDDKLPTRGEWTLIKYDLPEQLKWSIELEFHQSIVIWHVATEICHGLYHGKDYTERTAVKMLSDYMMYLLVVCPSRFSFCNKYKMILQDYTAMKELFNRGSVIPSGQDTTSSNTNTQENAVNAHRLVQVLKANPKRWEVMGSMWAEMLCYAADKCKAKNHIDEIRHGGEFLTHVWLLLFHFGITRKQERRTESTPKDEKDTAVKSTFQTCSSSVRDEAENAAEDAKYAGGIRASSEDLKSNNVNGWNVTQE